MRYKKLQLENLEHLENMNLHFDLKALVIIHAVNGTENLQCFVRELCFVWRSYKSEVFKR